MQEYNSIQPTPKPPELTKKRNFFKWGTHMNLEEDVKATEVLDTLFAKGKIAVHTKYAMVKYVILWAHKMIEMVE